MSVESSSSPIVSRDLLFLIARLGLGMVIILAALTYHHFQEADPVLSLVVILVFVVTILLMIYTRPFKFLADRLS